MTTISSREFRANQKSYLDQVSQGLELLVTRGKQSFKIIPVTDDDSLMSKEEFFAQIDEAIKQVKNGQYKRFSSVAELENHLAKKINEI